MLRPFFSDFRRILIAKTLFDLLKIAVAGALASKFFVEFPVLLRFALAGTIPLLLVSAILMCPRSGKE